MGKKPERSRALKPVNLHAPGHVGAVQHRVGLVETYFAVWAVYDMRLTPAVSLRTSLREDLICTTCGKGYFERDVTDQRLELVEEAAGAWRWRSGATWAARMR